MRQSAVSILINFADVNVANPNEDLEDLLGYAQDTQDDDEFGSIVDDDFAGGPTSPTVTEKQHRASLPLWLPTAYADMLEKITKEMVVNPSKRPSCYDRGSFEESLNPLFSFNSTPKASDLYTPSYFIWLPHTLIKKIPCPCCLAAGRKHQRGGAKENVPMLWKHGFAEYPRRITDLDRNVWLVGFRYRCSHPECRKTFLSWSSSLLGVLPPLLTAQFNFHLTCRAGLTDRVATLLRSCLARGVSVHAFTDMIRRFHIREYERRHLCYLQMIHAQRGSVADFFKVKYERFSEFGDRNGYAGYTPSNLYFQRFYVKFIEGHAHEMDQHMAMLSARVLSVDHSHKVCCRTLSAFNSFANCS